MNPNLRPDALLLTPSDLLYGFPLAHWTIRQDGMPALTARLYAEALKVLTEPDGEIARSWQDELDEHGYRAITSALTLPQVVSLVSELPGRTIVRITGLVPCDKARQEAVRALYAPAED
jgi:hypothetical protein